jgi:hypothetical protein
VTVTPLEAGLLAAVCVTGGLLSVPLLLDRGPVDRLAARAGVDTSGERRPLWRRLIDRLASPIGPRLAPGIRLLAPRRRSRGGSTSRAARGA